MLIGTTEIHIAIIPVVALPLLPLPRLITSSLEVSEPELEGDGEGISSEKSSSFHEANVKFIVDFALDNGRSSLQRHQRRT